MLRDLIFFNGNSLLIKASYNKTSSFCYKIWFNKVTLTSQSLKVSFNSRLLLTNKNTVCSTHMIKYLPIRMTSKSDVLMSHS